MGGDVPEHFSRREHCFVQSFFMILMFIGCFSVSTRSIAADLPASGGYFVILCTYGCSGSGPYSTVQEAIEGEVIKNRGCYPLGGPEAATACYGPVWIDESNSGPWAADTTANFVGSTGWAWSRNVRVLSEMRYFPPGTPIGTPGVGTQINWYSGEVKLSYQCPISNGSYLRMKDDPALWGPDQARPPQMPICTDGLPGGPPPPCQSNHSIRLQGPGGTAGALADVEPGASVNALSARVTCDGQPVSGKAVALTADVVSFTGGHQHDQGRRPQHSGTVSFNGSETTDANGNVSFTFTAPAPAGDHTITAQCSDGSCGTDTGSVWGGMQGLQPIGSGPWGLTGARPEHPDNHYLTVPAFLVLQQLGLQWRRLYVPFGPVFRVNDASLVRGGLFDCCETYTDINNVVHNRQIEGWWTPPHDEHRRGTVVDINGIRREDEDEFVDYAARELGAVARIHGAGTGRHFHVRLMGVAE